jgi:hypothetical protein
VGTTPTPEQKFDFICSRIGDLQNKEQRHLDIANAAIAQANGTGPHCVMNPERRPKSPVEAAVDHVETQLVCSTRAFVYSSYLSKLEKARSGHTLEESIKRVQRALGFALARKAADKITRSVSWIRTGAAEAELSALGELQLIFLEAETGDTSGDVL